MIKLILGLVAILVVVASNGSVTMFQFRDPTGECTDLEGRV